MKTEEKQARRRRPAARRERAQKSGASQDVVYTQPESFNRRRFVLRLLTVVAVVFALLIGIAIFFNVDERESTVAGNNRYTAWEIWEASGIQDGDNLLTLNKAGAASRIIQRLPYVDTVRIGIKLPDMVMIEIKELDVVYSIQSDDGSWWLISYDGRVVDKTTEAESGEKTKILGVMLKSPVVGEKAVAAEGEDSETLVRGTERLAAVIQVLTQLEESGVLGTISKLNVAELSNIELWYERTELGYEQRYQVSLGDTTQLEKKIVSMKQVITSRGDYQTGILDISFVKSDKVIYKDKELS